MRKILLFGLLLTSLFFTTALPVLAQQTSPNPINIETRRAKLTSSNFYIRVGDQYFYGKAPMRISSDAGPFRGTLEATWTENNREMRFHLYFQMTSNNVWELYEIRAYNTETQPNWIYFGPTDSLGNKMSSLRGQQNFRGGPVRFLPIDSSVDAEIYCEDCSMTAFILGSLNFSTAGYALDATVGLPANQIITLSTDPLTRYGVNVILYDQNTNVVLDQSGITYEWSSANSQIATVTADDLTLNDGTCSYGMQPPCPQINGQIAGISPGTTTITVKALRNGDEIARTQFPVNVVSHQQSTGLPRAGTEMPTIILLGAGLGLLLLGALGIFLTL